MVDIIIILAFVVYCVVNGFRNQKKASQGLEEYFLGGRTLKGWQAGFSMAATQFAADTPLLVTGLIATAGIFSLWRLWIYAIAFLLMGFLLGPCWHRARVLTDAEFTELRYSGQGASILRILKAVYMGTIVNCTVLAMVLVAAVRVAEPFLAWHIFLPSAVIAPIAGMLEAINFSLSSLPVDHPEYWLYSTDNFITIGAIIAFTTLYSMTGGLRSVVATDVLQFSLAMLGTLAYAWIVVSQAGGLAGLGEKLGILYGVDNREMLLSFLPLRFDEVTSIFLVVIAVQWFAQVNADGTGYLAQRTMACQTDKDAKQAAVIFTIGQVLIRSLFWLFIGVGLLVLYPAQELSLGAAADSFRIEREMTFVYGIRDVLPPGIRGLMLTGMLAALASTVDTHLNWGSSYWTNDLYKGWLMEKVLKRKPAGRELVWIARISYFFILAIATIIAANLGSIQGAWHLTLLFGSGLGVVLILRWVWHRINLFSEITAIVISLVLSLILLKFTDFGEGARLLTMLAVSTIAVIAVTLLTPPEPPERLLEFYKRVRPPGFWKPVVLAIGDKGDRPVFRLTKSLSATFLSAISIFLMLAGTGHFLLHDFGKGQWLSISLLITIVGIILVPFWWRLGFEENLNA